jgi:F-type H+-transporting ATPase subunit b
MPQLDSSAWPPQLFWLAVTFLVLFFVVSRVIIPRTGGTIERRKSTVEQDLATAARHRTESESVSEAYEAVLADARAKANATAMEARTALNAEIQVMTAKLDAELAAKASDADKAIAAAKTKALASIQDVAAEISSSIVTQLIGVKVPGGDVAAAVSKAQKQE